MSSISPLLLVALLGARVPDENVSGAPITPAEAAYDVLHYDLALRVDPDKRTIDGSSTMTARVVTPTTAIALALDGALDVEDVTSTGDPELDFTHRDGRVTVVSDTLFATAGARFDVTVRYGGVPREAPNPPWEGGFTWARTATGAPWIATSCQGEGADLWWPCKDQPSDEADSMDLRITVPDGLVVASNGRLVADEPDGDQRTWHWRVSTPINNYGVALNIAPYVTIEERYESIAGDVFPVIYWVLPENLEAGRGLFREILEHMAFFEGLLGPYPFRADKYGVAETPHLGMEHQSIVAYGNAYRGNPWGKDFGFDFLHHHEFAHEWWANLVTARDWNDYWIHEGFATYCQALYVERLHGRQAYLEEMEANRARILNRAPVAPRESRTTRAVYGDADGSPGGDIYFKGSWVLHTLRWVVGDEPFFRALRRMAYPAPELELATDGSACRFATTDEILALAEQHTGFELDWLFEVYLRRAALPELVTEVRGDTLHLGWKAPGDLAFPMPVPVRVGDEIVRVEMPDGVGSVALGGRSYEIDPEHRVLRRLGG